MKAKVLFLLKLPPPFTGATMMNKYVYDSETIRENFEVDSILMSYADSIVDLGSLRLIKLVKYIKYLSKLVYKTLFNRYEFAYFQISPLGISFIRDCLFVLILKLTNVKIIFHLHGKGIKGKQNNYVLMKLYQYVFKNESVIILSELLKHDIEDVHKGKVYIVPNGIDHISTNWYEHKPADEVINILFLSNLLESKGIYDFIEAMRILNKKGMVFNARVVGAEGDISGDELKKILVENSLQDKVKYLGAKYGDEKINVYETTNILVYPTHEDIWGNVNLEAMQFGIPVIATKEGAIPEIIDDGLTGFLVDKRNPNQIVEKIENLYYNRMLISGMGKAGREKFNKKYTLKIFEDNINKVFKENIH